MDDWDRALVTMSDDDTDDTDDEDEYFNPFFGFEIIRRMHLLRSLVHHRMLERYHIHNQRSDYLRQYWKMMNTTTTAQSSLSIQDVSTSTNVHVSRTPLKHLTISALSDLNLNIPAKGKYLLLRTLEPAYKMNAIHTFVEDHTGDGTLLCVYNMIVNSTDDCQEIFPVGVVLILKEPYFQRTSNERYMLRCDSPSDIIILQAGQKHFSLSNDVVWKNSPSSRPYPDSEYDSQKSADEWKVLGNQMYKKQKFLHAIRFYSRGLYEAEKSKDANLCKVFHLNLSAAYLYSGWYELAISHAEDVLKVDPVSQKAYFRVGKANYKLRKYAESREWFCKLLQKYPNLQQAKTELERCDNRLAEAQYGIHSVYKMMLERTCRPKTPIDCADYIGPIRVADIPGKGRGYVATKDLNPGTLVLVSKAIKVAWKDATNEQDLDDDLVAAVVDSLMKNPNTFRPIIENNFFGGLRTPENGEPSSQFCDPKMKEEPIIDVDKIRRMVHRRSFETRNVPCLLLPECRSTERLTKEAEARDGHSGRGLFLSACFFNHRCLSNGHYDVYNDVMFVHTTQFVKAGKEISLAYFPTDVYATRKRNCSRLGFRCDCRLCLLDETEPTIYVGRRLRHIEEIYSHLKYNAFNHSTTEEVKRLIAKLKGIYRESNRKELQVDLSLIYIWNAFVLEKCHLYIQAAQSALNSIRVWGFEPKEVLTAFKQTNSVKVYQSKFLNSMFTFALDIVIDNYMKSGALKVATTWVQIMIAVEEILSGGDIKVFKLKYPKYASLCDGL